MYSQKKLASQSEQSLFIWISQAEQQSNLLNSKVFTEVENK